jgi:cytochrome c biogenesis protein CcmG, thiol:disulfide interchange protein DsbE
VTDDGFDGDEAGGGVGTGLDSVAGDPAPGEAGLARPPRRRSHVVLWVSIGVAVVLCALIAVMASAKPSSDQGVSSPLIGKPAPAISGKALTGSATYSLAQFRGDWVLVNFAASWCIPCQEETPQLKTLYGQRTAATGAVVLAVAYDETDLGNLASFLRSRGAFWPAINDGQAVVEYGVSGIPESYLVDPEGTVVAKYLGGVTVKEVDAVISRAS